MTRISMKHSTMVRALFKKADAVMPTLTAHKINVLHAAVGIAGEGGEVLDEVKKCVFNNRAFDREKLVRELGDLEFYLRAIRQETGISRDECLEDNMKKLSERYANWVYSDQASLARADIQQTAYNKSMESSE